MANIVSITEVPEETEVDPEVEAQLRLDNLHSLCKKEIELSAGYDEDELVDARAEALDYYFGRPRGDELEGRSEIQSMDVADMTEATLAEIMPLYANPQLVAFGAVNAQDVQQARLESRYCNHMFMEINSGWTVLYEAVKDALLQKNAYIDTYVCERSVPEFSKYTGLLDIEVEEIASLDNDDIQIVEWDERFEFDEIIGEYPVYDITVRTMNKKKELICESFPPEDFGFTVNHQTNDPNDMRFCYRRIITTKGDLISQGHDVELVQAMKPYHETTNIDELARNQIADEDEYENYLDDYVEIFKCFAVYDYDEDGIPELNEILLTEDEIFERKWVKRVSFSSGSPFLMSHRFIGMSLHDKVKVVQDSKTKFLRQWHDNTDHMNNRRLEVVENQVNMEDCLNSRPGGVVRTKTRGVVNPIPTDDIGPSIQLALNYMDSVRSERGGASLDMQTSEIPIGDRVGSQGVERQYSSKEKIAAMIARTLAETLIRQTYFNIHAALNDLMIGPQEFEVEGTWFQTDPSRWLHRNNLKIDVGMSKGERDAKVGTLRSMLELQIKAMEMDGDGVLTDLTKIHNLIMDIGYCSGLQAPERYWINPNSPEAKKAMQDKQAAAQKAAEEAKLMQQMIFEYQRQIEEQKDKVDIYKEENKRLMHMKEQFNKMIQHNDKMRKDYTEMELEFLTDIPGEGQ